MKFYKILSNKTISISLHREKSWMKFLEFDCKIFHDEFLSNTNFDSLTINKLLNNYQMFNSFQSIFSSNSYCLCKKNSITHSNKPE